MAGHLKFAAISIMAAALLAAACSGGDDNDSLEDPGVLLAPGRTHLSLCVDAGGGREASDADFIIVQQALDSAISGLTVVPPEIGDPSLEVGCPPAVEFTGGSRTSMFYLQTANIETNERSLSPHRIFVYFIPEAVFLDAYLEGPFGWEISEYLCEHELVTPDLEELRRQGFPRPADSGGGCEYMTASVYVPSDASSDKVSAGILRALGLHERLPEPTKDWPACATGSDAPYCELYQECIAPAPPSPEYCTEEFWPLSGLTPLPPIDTLDWPTYESESLGFSMRYPPTWSVEVEDYIPPSVQFRNEGSQAFWTRRSEDGVADLSIEDRASIFVGGYLFMRFGIEAFIGNCSRTVIETTFAGQPATACGDSYWVELPWGAPIVVSGSATDDAEQRTRQLLDAALATITFRE